jgi:hypothetical protein
MRERDLLERLSDMGAAAQAAIPGLYAWAVTVAPAAWARGAPLVAKILAILGLAFLVGSMVIERRFPRWARPVSVWGLAGTSALVWVAAPLALSPTMLDAPRGLSGIIGWALFAFASAAPAMGRDPEGSRVVAGAPLRPRVPIPRGDAVFIVTGAALALALQAVGWHVNVPERALLVRLVVLASGLAVVGAATQLATARHARRTRPTRRVRMRRSMTAVMGLVFLALVGFALFALSWSSR